MKATLYRKKIFVNLKTQYDMTELLHKSYETTMEDKKVFL